MLISDTTDTSTLVDDATLGTDKDSIAIYVSIFAAILSVISCGITLYFNCYRKKAADRQLKLMEEGLRPNQEEHFISMAKANNYNGLIEFLNKKPPKFDINQTDNKGNSALHYAIRHGNKKMSNLLLEQEDINLDIMNAEGNTALHLAVQCTTNPEVVKNILCKRNNIPNIDLPNNEGKTPLHLAVEQDASEYVKNLVDNQASCIIEDVNKKKPIDYCHDDNKKIKQLLERQQRTEKQTISKLRKN